MKLIQIVSFIFIIIFQFIIPCLFIYWIAFKKSKSKINLIIKLITVWIFVFYTYFSGQWCILPFVLRYIFIILLFVSTIKSISQFKELELFNKLKIWGWIKLFGQLSFSFLFLVGLIEVIEGFYTKEKGIDIEFPLRNGFIAQGGNNVIINYHNEDSTSQQYALDISKLNCIGLRASRFFPKNLEDFPIFGDTVFAPCTGIITNVKDGLDNISPGTLDTKTNPAGNHIALEYKNNLIIFAHLLKNSLLIKAGDTVRVGQPLARVGNSGHTLEPHLHIHAIAGTDTSKIINGSGNGIPIYFKGKFPTRNDIFEK